MSPIERPGEDALTALSRRLTELQARRSDLQRQIEVLEAFGRDQDLVKSGVNEQRRRLHGLYLIPGTTESADVCPLCHSTMTTPTPAATELNRSLRLLNQELTFVSQDRAEVAEAIAGRRADLAEVEDAVTGVRRHVARLREEDQRARVLLERRNEMARVGGMIHMFLRVAGVPVAEDRTALEAEASALMQAIEDLEEETDFMGVRKRTATFLGGVGQTITTWARQQDLEYASGLLTFDVRGPRLVSETDAGTIPFSRFGSGKNWIWYHLLGHMALHKWFREKRRPVPHFLVLDQPSQVYFPSGDPHEGEPDIEEVRRIYAWLSETTATLGNEMQVIVTDHARFPEDGKFMDHLEYDWWENDDALIPRQWISTD